MRQFIKEEKEWLVKNKVYICILCLITMLFSLLYFNRFAPDTMGWQLYNAILMEKGKMVYRDFFNYLPPGSLFRTIWAYGLTGGSIVGYRVICIIERVFLTFLIFKILSRFFPSKYAWIACVTGMILTATTVVDQFGDYNQTYKVYLLLGTYWGIKFFEYKGNKKAENITAVLLGISLGMVMLYKQSIGVIAPACFLLMLIIYSVIEKDKSFVRYTFLTVLGYLIPVGLCAAWLAGNQALLPFVEQVFKSAAAKGDSRSLILRFWDNIFKVDCLLISIPIFGLIVIREILRKSKVSQIKKKNFLRCSLIGASVLEIFFIYEKYGLYIGDFFKALHITGMFYFFGFILLAFLVYYYVVNKDDQNRVISEKCEGLKACMLGGGMFLCIYMVSCLSIENVSSMYWESNFFGAKEDFPIFSAYVLVCMMAVCFIYYIIKKKTLYSLGYMFMVLSFFTIIYEGGMATGTKGLTYIITCVSIPYMLCLIFSYHVPYNKIKNIIVLSACIFICVLSMMQKYTEPYSWWGWGDTPISREDQYSIDLPRMEGFRVTRETKVTYEKTVELIVKNSDEKDFVLTFPHMKLFNILSDRMEAPTFVVSYFFDVCPDEYALSDAKIIEKTPPKIVVMNAYDEEFWNYNENAFRGGEKSGQRKILEWFENNRSNYAMIGRVNGLEIYRILDGTPIKSVYYEENDRSTIETAEDNSFSIVDVLMTQLHIGEDAFGHAAKIFAICISFVSILLLIFYKNQYYHMFLLITSVVGICLHITPLYFFIYVIAFLLYGSMDKSTRRFKDKLYFGIVSMMVFLAVVSFVRYQGVIKNILAILITLLFLIIFLDGIKNIYSIFKIKEESLKKYVLLTVGVCCLFTISQIIFTETPWWNIYTIPFCSVNESIQIFGLICICIWGLVVKLLKNRNR